MAPGEPEDGSRIRTDRGAPPVTAAPDDSTAAGPDPHPVVVLQWMGATAIVPMLPLYIRHLGGSDALAGAVMASFYAAGVLSQYPMGRLADRIGSPGRAARRPGDLQRGQPVLPAPHRRHRGHRPARPPGSGGRGGHRRRPGPHLRLGAPGPPGPRLRRRLRRRAGRHGRRSAGREHRRGPHMWAMFLASGLLSFGACIPALRLDAPTAVPPPPGGADPDGTTMTAAARVGSLDAGALLCAGVIGLTSGVYDICWTLLLLARGASGLAIGISWTLFAVPFVLAARPSGWLADHMDRRALVLVGLGAVDGVLCRLSLHPQRPLLVVLGAIGGHGLRRSHAGGPVAAHPGIRAVRGRAGSRGCSPPARQPAPRCRPPRPARPSPWPPGCPLSTVAAMVSVGLAVVAAIWMPVIGRVERYPAGSDHGEPIGSIRRLLTHPRSNGTRSPSSVVNGRGQARRVAL